MSRHIDSLTPAQLCNRDVLLDLFPYLPEADLARAALVCRAWSVPARMSLYDTISFNTKSPRVTQLTWTLRTCPELRKIVRHLTYTSHYGDHEPPDWLALLPEGSLRTFNWGSKTMMICPGVILRLPAVRAVSKLVLHIHPWSETEDVWSAVQDMMHSPSLRSLSVGPFVAKHVSFPSGLRRFSVFAYSYTEQVKQLVMDPNTLLERFDAHIRNSDLCEARALMQDLRQYQTRLKHLTLISSVHWECMQIMEESLCSFPFLETLVCSSAVYASTLIFSLPPTIRSLTMIEGAFALHRSLNFTRVIRRCLASAEGESYQRRLPERITIVDVCMYDWELARPVKWEFAFAHRCMNELAGACTEAGVRLDWVGVKGEEYDHLQPYGIFRPYLV